MLSSVHQRLRTALRLGVATAFAAAALVPLTADPARAGGATSPCPSAPDKCYSFTMTTSPATVHLGELVTYTGKLSNLSKGGTGVQLGAANITWTPADSFYAFVTGTVSPQGTQARADNVLQLRNLNLSPGKTSTFTFQARAIRGGTITFTSTAKQSNNYAGTGNDLVPAGDQPRVTISGSCSDDVTYDAYGCSGIVKTQGGTVSTGSVDSNGNPSQVTAVLVIPAVQPLPGSSPVQVMALRTYLDGEGCPVQPFDCDFVVQLLNKLDGEYDGAHSATLTVTCGSLCGALTVLYQQDEGSGTTEPVPPCSPLPPVPSPLTGSTVCFVNNGDGTITLFNITTVNDWKVAGITAP